MHKTERRSWKCTEDSSLQVYRVNRRAGGCLLSWALDAQVTNCIPGMHPMAGDRWPAPLPSSWFLAKVVLWRSFFFFFLVSPFLFSTSFSIVYSANGQISLNPVGTEQLGRVSWSQNTQSPHKTLYLPPGFSKALPETLFTWVTP